MSYTLNDYQEDAARTAQEDMTLRDGVLQSALGVAGEAGEYVDAVKKILFHKHPVKSDDLCKELGDILWYVAEAARCWGFSLERVAQRNIEKLKERYPDGFDPEKSTGRKEDTE